MTEPTANTPLVNPYPDKYPELRKGFVSLTQKLEKRWGFAKWFMLNPDRSDAIETFMTFATFSTLVSGVLCLAISDIRAETGLQCFLPSIAFITGWLIRWRIDVILQRQIRADIQTFVDSIPESTLLDVTVCLRDFAINDPVMSAKDKEYKKSKEDAGEPAVGTYDDGTEGMALLLVKHPSPLNTFRAIEYLIADYPRSKTMDPDDAWGLDYFNTIRSTNTYTGFLAGLDNDRRIELKNKEREAVESAAKEKLAALKPISVHTEPRSV